MSVYSECVLLEEVSGCSRMSTVGSWCDDLMAFHINCESFSNNTASKSTLYKVEDQ